MSKTKYPNKGWIRTLKGNYKWTLTDDVTKQTENTSNEIRPGPKPLDSEIDWYVFGLTGACSVSIWLNERFHSHGI